MKPRRRRAAPETRSLRLQALLGPAILGIGILVAFPTTAAYQDMSSLVSGEAGGPRWSTFLERSVAGSVQAADMPFADGDATGSISGAGRAASTVGKVALRAKVIKGDGSPDEARILRADKRGRIIAVTPVAPPKAFSAGSILERTSMLLRPALPPSTETGFAQAPDRGTAVQTAQAFFTPPVKKPDPMMPADLAALVNNDRPDVLATAYASPEPAYSLPSPFESLLRDEAPNGGRFIPPIDNGDHAWMRQPLPPGVFGDNEQKCLATAVYFEARGETTRGQAAVAQVILNRVRNPAYPKTICGVVYQNAGWRNACQFSFACDDISDRITDPRSYAMAQDVAMAVTSGKVFIDDVGSATHYHANYVHPRWARTMEKMKQIGLHIFYRTYGGGWS